ncbi:GTPase [Phytoactinopolyspora mesophila]|uniref:ABC transporter n=1 Tax=Phytoactinopolyspora mesophila TaxID=2650750 RepID=A0A7K3M6P0_9ACTN|nr:GTPase [Phytoactinopolyspora mesophila]NDL58983.1 ABC transporter [Phytoactinopolyspora mesophila]
MTTRLGAISGALEAGAGRFFDPSTTEARAVLERAGARLELSLEHTVVALAGSTGSGKSSLFNAICGMDIARVGVRRPTTSLPLACIWGAEGVDPLLDWLEVPALNRVSRESVLDSGEDDALDGLVLLDLPDHDSTESMHRDTVDRLVELVDLFIWVMDPQKYADAVIHEQYLRPLSAHSDVTVVLLNQVDRLPEADAEACLNDLRRLLDEDGLASAPLLPVSAATGVGLDILTERLRVAVLERQAIRNRIEADAQRIAARMESALGSTSPGEIGETETERLVASLGAAAGIDVMAEQAGEAYLRRGSAGVLPEPPPVDRPTVEAAVHEVGRAAMGSLAGGWGGSVRALAAEQATKVPAALHDTLMAVDLYRPPSGRWRLSGVLEWLALIAGLFGGLWALLLELAARLDLAWLNEIDLPDPDVAGSSLPLILLVAGGFVGLVLTAARFGVARRARRQRTEEAERLLRDVVADVADEMVISPLRVEIDRYHTFRAALAEASE